MMSCFRVTQPPRGEEYGVNMGKPRSLVLKSLPTNILIYYFTQRRINVFFSSSRWWGLISSCLQIWTEPAATSLGLTRPSPASAASLQASSAPRSSFLIRHLQCCAMAGRGGAQRTNGTAASSKICQFKLVLLGESAVGKSSLVLRFVKGQFHEYQESTIGGERRWSPRDECAELIQRSHVLPILTPLIFRKRWLLASGRGEGGWFAVPSICLEVGL